MECKGFRKKWTVQVIVRAFVVSMIFLSSLSCLYDLWPWEKEGGLGHGGLGEPCYPNNTCDSSYICVEGICEPACESLEDSCTEEGYEECLEDMNGYRICGFFSEEYPECLVWGETEFCEDDEVYKEGECRYCGGRSEPCCFYSVCGEGFQCNNETGMCEAHSCTGLSSESCGKCGVKTRTCEDGEWSDWGDCMGEGECTFGDTQERDCGNTGIETRTCGLTCEWEDWGLCTGETVTVPAGLYWMGCNDEEDNECHSDGSEEPYHPVNVPEFEIDKFQVTQGLYRVCVNVRGCTAPSTHSNYCNWNHNDREDHPVNCINWHQARGYCHWAGKRLCSESEWEKAARGTDGRKYPWGNQTATCHYALMDDGGRGCGENRTWPVGSKPPGASPYGALDMAGNVWEWVEDDWHDDYEGAPTDGSAWVDSPRASKRVGRGGSLFNSAGDLRASRRFYYNPGDGSVSFGVRCCR